MSNYNKQLSDKKNDSDNLMYYGIAATIGFIVLGLLVFAQGFNILAGIVALAAWFGTVYVYKNYLNYWWIFPIGILVVFLILVWLG